LASHLSYVGVIDQLYAGTVPVSEDLSGSLSLEEVAALPSVASWSFRGWAAYSLPSGPFASPDSIEGHDEIPEQMVGEMSFGTQD